MTEADIEATRSILERKGVEWQKQAVDLVNQQQYAAALEAALKAHSLRPQNTQIADLVSLLKEKVSLDESSGDEDCDSQAASGSGSEEESGGSDSDSDCSSNNSSNAASEETLDLEETGDLSGTLRTQIMEDALQNLTLADASSAAPSHPGRLRMPDVPALERQERQKLRAKLAAGTEALKDKLVQGDHASGAGPAS